MVHIYVKVVIPIGEECYCCSSIDKKFSLNGTEIRTMGFPYDYVAGSHIDRIYNDLYKVINNDFFLTKDDFEVVYIENFNYVFRQKNNNFTYIHDLTSEDGNFSEKDIYKFIQKYNRRYERLKDVIKTSDSITFLSVNHFTHIYHKNYKKNEILKLYNFLYEINNNIKFLAINYHYENETHNTLEFVNLDINREVTKPESKVLFVPILNKFVSEYFN